MSEPVRVAAQPRQGVDDGRVIGVECDGVADAGPQAVDPGARQLHLDIAARPSPRSQSLHRGGPRGQNLRGRHVDEDRRDVAGLGPRRRRVEEELLDRAGAQSPQLGDAAITGDPAASRTSGPAGNGRGAGSRPESGPGRWPDATAGSSRPGGSRGRPSPRGGRRHRARSTPAMRRAPARRPGTPPTAPPACRGWPTRRASRQPRAGVRARVSTTTTPPQPNSTSSG